MIQHVDIATPLTIFFWDYLENKTHLTVDTGDAFAAMPAGIQASSSHSLIRVCLIPTSAARPPAAWGKIGRDYSVETECSNFRGRLIFRF